MTKHHLPSVKRLDSRSKNVTPSGFDAASCHRRSTLHLKRTGYGRSSWLGRNRRITLVTSPLRRASSETLRKPELKSGYCLCNKHVCCGLKEWKPGSSSGFCGISPPARQPMALGGKMLSARRSFVFSSLTLSRLPFPWSVRANAEKEGIHNSGDVKFSELSFSTDTEMYFSKFNS